MDVFTFFTAGILVLGIIALLVGRVTIGMDEEIHTNTASWISAMCAGAILMSPFYIIFVVVELLMKFPITPVGSILYIVGLVWLFLASAVFILSFYLIATDEDYYEEAVRAGDGLTSYYMIAFEIHLGTIIGIVGLILI